MREPETWREPEGGLNLKDVKREGLNWLGQPNNACKVSGTHLGRHAYGPKLQSWVAGESVILERRVFECRIDRRLNHAPGRRISAA